MSPQEDLLQPGALCASDLWGVPHTVEAPAADDELLAVAGWLRTHDLERVLTGAVTDAVDYVLDGARTWRFDLNSPDVDSDERRTVGTKLQYRVLAALGLEKRRPLDTQIRDIPVDLKGTIGSSWMIPREGQCEVCVLFQVDTKNDRHRAFLMRPHRVWLNAENQDKKRSIRSRAVREFATPLIEWTALPRNPLKLLTEKQRAEVFAPGVGQARRLTALFGFLPDTVIPRSSILTVCANREDPMRRARQVKQQVLEQHRLLLLCGRWKRDQAEAGARGHDLGGAAWVAVEP